MTTLQTDDIRRSASVIIVNLRDEILLVHRNPKLTAFGGFHVFPGGNFDAKQDDTLQMTAIRETFEESGILLASASGPSQPQIEAKALLEARQSVYKQEMTFPAFLDRHHLQGNYSSLHPFTQWVTPVNAPRRFRTQFFITFLPETLPPDPSSEDQEEYIPSTAGDPEVVSARFIHPEDAISEFRQGRISLMPPQYYILFTLAGILRTPMNSIVQRDQLRTLSAGAFGRMVVNPEWMRGTDHEGRKTLVYEGDETRGGPKGRLHRSLLEMGKGGTITNITLFRNFDIFSEVEDWNSRTSKL